MGSDTKPEKKDVLELISSKSQCKAKNPNPNSVNSPSNKKQKKNKKKKKTMMTWRRKMTDEIIPVRRLFNTCKQVFSNGGPGIVPSVDKIQQLRDVLGMRNLIQISCFFALFLFWVNIKFRF